MIQLSPEPWKSLCDALVDAFDGGALAALVRFNLPYRHGELVNVQGPIGKVVLDLLEALIQRGELEPFLRGVVNARPNKPELLALCRTIAPQVFARLDIGALVGQVNTGLGALLGYKDTPKSSMRFAPPSFTGLIPFSFAMKSRAIGSQRTTSTS
jgi:hypothetical protein